MVKRLVLVLFLVGALLTFVGSQTIHAYSVHAVLSGSMGKSAPRGSLIVSRKLSPEQYGVGDIITFPIWGTSQTVTHRIVRIEHSAGGSVVMTRGDANPNGDGWSIPTGLIVGKVIVVVPLVGFLCMFLRTVPGFVLFALFTLGLVVLPLCRLAWFEWVQKSQPALDGRSIE